MLRDTKKSFLTVQVSFRRWRIVDNLLGFFVLNIVSSLLKGLCHADFVVLGQFCAKIDTSGFTYAHNVPDKLWGARGYLMNCIKTIKT